MCICFEDGAISLHHGTYTVGRLSLLVRLDSLYSSHSFAWHWVFWSVTEKALKVMFLLFIWVVDAVILKLGRRMRTAQL